MSAMNQVDSLDENRLSEYLQQHVDGFAGPATFSKFSGGQSNPTFKIATPNATYVLRRQPPGKLLKSAHAVDREFRVIKALSNTNVPVATPYHLCEDTDIIGSMFYVMGFCDGRIFWDAQIDSVNNEERGRIYSAMNEALANIHSLDVNAVGLGDYGRPGNYFQRQLARWTQQYRASEIQPIEAMNSLIKWLEDHMPEDDGRVSLVHGDYRLDNIIFAPDSPDILAIIDWELSTLGHPFADLAYQCMQLRMPSNVKNISGLAGIDRSALNIPSEREYVQQYCDRMGIANIDHWAFYLAFSFFRLAAIIQGVAKRALDGNASSKDAAAVGAFVEPLAQMAWQVIKEEA